MQIHTSSCGFIYCLVLLAIFATPAFAQLGTITYRPYPEKIQWVDSFYFSLATTNDSAKIFTASQQLKQYAIDHKDGNLMLEARLDEAYYYRKKMPGQDQVTLKWLTKLADQGRKEKKAYITVRAVHVIAIIYWFRIQNYELSFKYFRELEQLMHSITPAQYPFMANGYYDIGRAFYIFKEYNQALYYLKRSSAVPETSFNTRILCATNNMAGLIYQQLNMLDSSDLYFNKGLHLKYVRREHIYYSIIQGNVGHNFYLKKDYDKAIPLLQQDMIRACREGRNGLAAGSATTLATIYLAQGRLEKVKLLTDSIFMLIRSSKQLERLQYLYPIVSRYYAAIGDLQRSNLYLDSALKYNDSMSRKFSSMQLARAEQETDFVREQTRKSTFQAADRQSRKLWYWYIAIMVLLLIVAIFIYYRQRKRNKRKETLQTQKLQAFKMELKKAEAQLQEFSDRLTVQSNQIEELEGQHTGDQTDHILTELRQRAILTEDDWQKFRHSFDRVHPGFIDRLKEKYPQLSPAEIRVLVLARLRFLPKEMAAALGISLNSIHVTWHRLRKKLNLNQDVSLETLATQI